MAHQPPEPAWNRRLRAGSFANAQRDRNNDEEKWNPRKSRGLLSDVEIVDENVYGCTDGDLANETRRDFLLSYTYQLTIGVGATPAIMDQAISDIEKILALRIAEESCAMELEPANSFWFSPQPSDAANETENCTTIDGELCHSVIGAMTVQVPNHTQVSDDLACKMLGSIHTLLHNDTEIVNLPNLSNIVVPDSPCPQETYAAETDSSPSREVKEPLILFVLALLLGISAKVFMVLHERHSIQKDEFEREEGSQDGVEFSCCGFLRDLIRDFCEYTKVFIGQLSVDISTARQSLRVRVQRTKSKDSLNSCSPSGDGGDDATAPSSEGNKSPTRQQHNIGVVWDDFEPGAFPTGRSVNSSLNSDRVPGAFPTGQSGANSSHSSVVALDAIPETEEYVSGHGRGNILYDTDDVHLSQDMTEL